MNQRACNVLFLCTGNSARSIMAEAPLNMLGEDRFRVFSAGSRLGGKVQPEAAELAQSPGCPAERMRSKNRDEFAAAGAPEMDMVITVCDNAAGESCPVGPGHPAVAHWSVPDPVAVDDSEDRRRRAFVPAFATLRRRVELLVALPLDKFGRLAAQGKLREIGGQ